MQQQQIRQRYSTQVPSSAYVLGTGTGAGGSRTLHSSSLGSLGTMPQLQALRDRQTALDRILLTQARRRNAASGAPGPVWRSGKGDECVHTWRCSCAMKIGEEHLYRLRAFLRWGRPLVFRVSDQKRPFRKRTNRISPCSSTGANWGARESTTTTTVGAEHSAAAEPNGEEDCVQDGSRASAAAESADGACRHFSLFLDCCGILDCMRYLVYVGMA